MSRAGCKCCRQVGGPCQSLSSALTIHTWKGSQTIGHDLRTLPAWSANKLSQYETFNLLWQVVLVSTGDVTAGRKLCLRQNRRSPHEWTAPANNVNDFHNVFDPLNVGTLWKGRLRNGYGSIEARSIHRMADLSAPFTGLPMACGDNRNHTFAETADVTFDHDASGNGRIICASTLPLEFALQVMCLGCYFAADYDLWGMNETQSLTWIEPNGNRVKEMTWWGPDSFDAHLRNESFAVNGVVAPCKPACPPEIVYLGDGSYEETQFANDFNRHFVHPTGDIERLKSIYGTKISYWGGWLRVVGTTLFARFDEYDFSDAEVLFLGGLNVQTVGSIVPRQYEWAGYSFDSASLQPLRDWLSLGKRLLVLDGGLWPENFIAALGLASTIEPFGGPATDPSLNALPVYGPVGEPPVAQFERLYCEPQSHPFNVNVLDSFGHTHISLIDITQKWAYGIHTADIREYTTAVPVVTPPSGSSVIGRIKGELPYPDHLDPDVVVAVDYPGIVVEPWTGNATSRIVVSQINELIPEDELGNWPFGGTPKGYGHGLSRVASEQFLLNLWEQRNEF